MPTSLQADLAILNIVKEFVLLQNNLPLLKLHISVRAVYHDADSNGMKEGKRVTV